MKKKTVSNVSFSSDLNCFLCNSAIEFVDHLLFNCRISALCWMHSSWKIRIGQFAAIGWMKWLFILLDQKNDFPIDEEGKHKILQFGTVLFEQIWIGWQGGWMTTKLE